MTDKTELVLHDPDGKVLDTIVTTLPSEVSSLRGRGYTTADEYESLRAAREAHSKTETVADDDSTDDDKKADANPAATGNEDASKKATAKGSKGPTNTGR